VTSALILCGKLGNGGVDFIKFQRASNPIKADSYALRGLQNIISRAPLTLWTTLIGYYLAMTTASVEALIDALELLQQWNLGYFVLRG
jgi:hypothetical protein